MLDELPSGGSLAARKARWFATRPGYPELRRALRITEPDGSLDPLQPAPRATFPLVVAPPPWMLGTWRGQLKAGTKIVYQITPDDILRLRFEAEAEVECWSYRDLRSIDELATVDLYEMNESFYLHQVSLADNPFSGSFRLAGNALNVNNERLGTFALERQDP